MITKKMMLEYYAKREKTPKEARKKKIFIQKKSTPLEIQTTEHGKPIPFKEAEIFVFRCGFLLDTVLNDITDTQRKETYTRLIESFRETSEGLLNRYREC